jgi:uncharacterized protein YbaR (Trm112 family)
VVEVSETKSVISPEMLAVLVCPVDKSELRLEGDELVCTVCGRRYPVVDGVPNMLVDDPN